MSLQIHFHEALYNLVRVSNEYYLTEVQNDVENAVNGSDITRLVVDSQKGLSVFFESC
jgi:hypothetical protein